MKHPQLSPETIDAIHEMIQESQIYYRKLGYKSTTHFRHAQKEFEKLYGKPKFREGTDIIEIEC